MAEIDPEQARNDPKKAGDALNEESGLSYEGDTPPDAGSGVGPTNHELDVDRPGDSAKGKIALAVIIGLVALFVVLWFVGAVVGMF
ncbi:UNVERIFIED_CONTAM: DUF6480 family protein [Kocuria sp. CPCC 205316]|uniref:DUF6480 family protein n=1 Tax=Kocuria TaxID=57493 RepID=UPI0034D487D7